MFFWEAGLEPSPPPNPLSARLRPRGPAPNAGSEPAVREPNRARSGQAWQARIGSSAWVPSVRLECRGQAASVEEGPHMAKVFVAHVRGVVKNEFPTRYASSLGSQQFESAHAHPLMSILYQSRNHGIIENGTIAVLCCKPLY